MTLYVEEITNSNEGLIRLLLEYVTNSDAQVSESAIYGLKRVLCSNIDKKGVGRYVTKMTISVNLWIRKCQRRVRYVVKKGQILMDAVKTVRV
jgi:hypothetical protein